LGVVWNYLSSLAGAVKSRRQVPARADESEAAVAKSGPWDEAGPRLAVLGTPRSGNTWLRRVLATGYAIEGDRGRELAIHDPLEPDWGAPAMARSIVQVHVRRDAAMAGLLASHAVRVIVPRRHPFDVLVSILQYATHVHDTHLWLAGEGGDEASIRGLDPCHPAFLDYATGPRAAALFAVSPSWWDAPGSVPVRYEDLVARPEPTLDGIARAIGRPPEVPWTEALERNTMDRLRQTHGFGHIWQGRPGLWRSLLTPEAVERLVLGIGPILATYGEAPEADPSLTPGQALENWRSLN